MNFRVPGGWLRAVKLTGIGIVLALSGGFAWFVATAESKPRLPSHADGIVALTGGADRVADALRLLAEGRADRMLVTGIGGGAVLRDLAQQADIDARGLASRITLGRGAASTHGNALETAAWVRENGIGSLIVVTAFYHMPRAITEMQRALPTVQLYPAPVCPPGMRAVSWTGLRVLGEEYVKLLAALSGMTSFESDPGPILSAARSISGHT